MRRPLVRVALMSTAGYDESQFDDPDIKAKERELALLKRKAAAKKSEARNKEMILEMTDQLEQHTKQAIQIVRDK